MALLDISYVTQTMINLLRESFDTSPAWTGAVPSVLPEPPHRIPGTADNTLGFYLYHITENAHYKNLSASGSDHPPVRFTPMGLNLYYQLSANHVSEEGTGAQQEQLMMGIAMKALHDYPEINDTTEVNGNQVMHANIRGRTNIFKISLQPVTSSESIQYWTAGDSPIKLSSYYEISVVLLEPESVQTRVSRVLSYGVHVFTQGAPRLMSSQNVISFPFPGESTLRSIKLQPAQAPPSPPPPPPAPELSDSQITFSGTGLSGDNMEILLLNASWDEPGLAGEEWNVQARGERFTAVVRESVTLLSSGTEKSVLPGIYAAQLRVSRQHTSPGGVSSQIRHLSNQCPFTITPRIDAINGPVGNVFTVDGYIFQHSDLFEEEKQVYVGDNRLEGVAAAPPGAGQFFVVDQNHLQLRLPAGLTSGQHLPLRILINGAESAPRWLSVP